MSIRRPQISPVFAFSDVSDFKIGTRSQLQKCYGQRIRSWCHNFMVLQLQSGQDGDTRAVFIEMERFSLESFTIVSRSPGGRRSGGRDPGGRRAVRPRSQAYTISLQSILQRTLQGMSHYHDNYSTFVFHTFLYQIHSTSFHPVLKISNHTFQNYSFPILYES